MRSRAVSLWFSATQALVLSGGMVFAVPSAHAQPRSAATAEQLFQEGRQLMQEGSRIQEGCAKLAQSQALDPAAGTLLNLAECYEKLNQLSTAFATYKQAWAAANERKRTDWASFAEERMRSLEPRLPRIRFTGQKPQGAHVELDGRPLAGVDPGVSLRVDPGDHRIVVVLGEREIVVRTVRVAEATTTDVSLDESPGPKGAPAPSPSPAPAPAPSNAGGGISPAVWILGATSLAAFAGTGSLLFVREAQIDSIVRDCGKDGTALPPALYASCSTRGVGTMTALAIGGFALGAGLAAAALIVHLTSNSQDTSHATGARAMCAPGFGGATCVLRF